MAAVPANVWKLTLAPTGGTDPDANPFEFCQENQIIGIGWALPRAPTDAADGERLLRKHHRSGIQAFRDIAVRMRKGDHVWVYGGKRYFVCRICRPSDPEAPAPYEYQRGSEWDRHDIHHVRPACWREVPVRLVPGFVKRYMTMRGTTLRMARIGEESKRVSAWLYGTKDREGELVGGANEEELVSQLSAMTADQVLRVFDADELEDLIGLFVQNHGWRMIKSSTYRSQRRVECSFRRVRDFKGETAYMQVKSGDIPLSPADFADLAQSGDRVFLFSTASNPYSRTDTTQKFEGIECLEAADVKAFVLRHLELLPPSMLVKLRLYLRASR